MSNTSAGRQTGDGLSGMLHSAADETWEETSSTPVESKWHWLVCLPSF